METMFLFMTIGAIGIGVHYAYANFRKKKVQEVANRLGFKFSSYAGILNELRQFPMTDQDHSKKAINCIEGEANGVTVRLLEYCYVVGRGRYQTPVSHTVAYLTSANCNFPCFQVRTKSFFDKLKNAIGGRKLSFTPEFDARYVVQTNDEQRTRMLFCDPVMRELMSQGRCIEAEGNGFVLYRPNYTASHTQLEDFLKDSIKMMMLLQSSVDNPAPATKEPEIVKGPDGRLRLARV